MSERFIEIRICGFEAERQSEKQEKGSVRSDLAPTEGRKSKGGSPPALLSVERERERERESFLSPAERKKERERERARERMRNGSRLWQLRGFAEHWSFEF